MPKQTKVKVIKDVVAAQIIAVNITLDDGSIEPMTTPAVIGDWMITDLSTDMKTIMSNDVFVASEQV